MLWNRLSPEIDIFSTEANNSYQNIVIVIIIAIVIIVIIIINIIIIELTHSKTILENTV